MLARLAPIFITFGGPQGHGALPYGRGSVIPAKSTRLLPSRDRKGPVSPKPLSTPGGETPPIVIVWVESVTGQGSWNKCGTSATDVCSSLAPSSSKPAPVKYGSTEPGFGFKANLFTCSRLCWSAQEAW